jgi:hypothetical protein
MKKNNDKEKWLTRLQERLSDYQEPVDLQKWEEIEKHLPKTDNHHIIAKYWIWSAAAVVAVLLSIGYFTNYFYSPSNDNFTKNNLNKYSNVNAQVIKKQVENDITNKSSVDVSSNNLIAYVHNKRNNPIYPCNIKSNDAPTVENNKIDKEEEIDKAAETKPETKPSNKNVTRNESAAPKRHTVSKSRSNNYNLLAYGENKVHKPWGIAVVVGTGGSSNEKMNNGELSYSDVTMALPYLSNELDKSESYYNNIKLNHHVPISIGLTVRKELQKHFSAETGVVFTLLRSDVANSINNKKQNIIYIGIPVKGNYTLIDKKPIEVYVTAGGMIEKCIYAHIDDEHLPTSSYQLSTNAGVGIQYLIAKHLGIYAETGAVYYFDNKSMLNTIRTKSPFNINLQAGFRLSY